ncbi:MAG: type II toxin-antitoxin system RelE/ParE family toxin [Desulfarculus sp.]|nr:type II toxin-antitoxin system RelE/ParE family toxin [Desulfarculus sp.]
MKTSWTIHYHSAGLQQDLLALPSTLQARYLHLTRRMLEFGPDLGLPHTKALGDGLFEMRLKGAEGIARVLNCTLSGRRIIVLHQFIKKSDQTPAREIAVARRRMKEVK